MTDDFTRGRQQGEGHGTGQSDHRDIAGLGLVPLRCEPLLDAPSQGLAEPLDGPVDGGVLVRSRASYPERAGRFKSHGHNTSDLVRVAAVFRVTQHDPNSADASSVARHDGEHAVLSIRTSLSVDRVVTADDSDSMHTQGNRKARATSRTGQALTL